MSKSKEILNMTADIAAAYLSRNEIESVKIPEVIQQVFDSITQIHDNGVVLQDGDLMPAVPISKSVTPDYIICLEDGKKLKMLKRYIRTRYKLSPEDYRKRWNLPSDYPMVAPNYAIRRSNFAKQFGLGNKRKA